VRRDWSPLLIVVISSAIPDLNSVSVSNVCVRQVNTFVRRGECNRAVCVNVPELVSVASCTGPDLQ